MVCFVFNFLLKRDLELVCIPHRNVINKVILFLFGQISNNDNRRRHERGEEDCPAAPKIVRDVLNEVKQNKPEAASKIRY